MNDAVAMSDERVEAVERIAARVLEILLHFHVNVVPRQIVAQLIAVKSELGCDCRNKDAYRHEPISI